MSAMGLLRWIRLARRGRILPVLGAETVKVTFLPFHDVYD